MMILELNLAPSKKIFLKNNPTAFRQNCIKIICRFVVNYDHKRKSNFLSIKNLSNSDCDNASLVIHNTLVFTKSNLHSFYRKVNKQSIYGNSTGCCLSLKNVLKFFFYTNGSTKIDKCTQFDCFY